MLNYDHKRLNYAFCGGGVKVVLTAVITVNCQEVLLMLQWSFNANYVLIGLGSKES